MAPTPDKTTSVPRSAAAGSAPPKTPTRNRRIVEQPISLSDGSTEGLVGPQGVTTSQGGVASAPLQVPPCVPRAPALSLAEAGVVEEEDPVGDNPVKVTGPSELPQGKPAQPLTADASWGALIEDRLRTVETAAMPATEGPIARVGVVPAREEPEGSIGAPAAQSGVMFGPLSAEWVAFPRRESSFTFEDLVALGRRDTRLVDSYTQTDASWAPLVRERFLRNHWLGYLIPESLGCDRTMTFDPLDGIYLQGMIDFLSGKAALPSTVDSRLWKFDLPSPSGPGTRTVYDCIRTQCSVTYGFGREITFADHDTLRVNEAPAARYDVVTAANERQTKYRVPLEQFPPLPSWITTLKLPGGLCVKLPRILRYFGSEVECPLRFARNSTRLTYTVRLEMARALASALDLDYYHSQIVWVLSEEAINFLGEFASTPKVAMPAQGGHPATLRGIDDVASACRAARSLGEEYLFERYHLPSGEFGRWAFKTATGFVTADAFSGPKRGGKPLGAPRRRGGRGRRSDGGPSPYFGGFTQSTEHPVDLHVASERIPVLSTLVADRDIRHAPGFGFLIEDRSVREGGWSVRELLGVAIDRIREAERSAKSAEERCQDLDDRLRTADRQVEMWREHFERVARPYSNAPNAPGYYREYPSRPVAAEKRMPASYGNDAKRPRYTYYDRFVEERDGAGPSAPLTSQPEDPYAERTRSRRRESRESPWACDPYYR